MTETKRHPQYLLVKGATLVILLRQNLLSITVEESLIFLMQSANYFLNRNQFNMLWCGGTLLGRPNHRADPEPF